MIIYIDHAVIIEIANQTYLELLATDKLNLKLIQASQYLSQFNLDIKY